MKKLYITDCIRKIVKYEGWRQLWSGTKASLWLVSNPAVQFMVYEFLKRNLQLYLNSPVSSDIVLDQSSAVF